MKVKKLLADQIPLLWDAIKDAYIKVNNFPEEHIEVYMHQLLLDLLSDKAQCFVRLSDNDELMGVMITKIVADRICLDKSLLIDCLYVYQSVPQETWGEDLKIILDFAKQTECRRIITMSHNPKIWALVDSLGFVESSREFTLELGG